MIHFDLDDISLEEPLPADLQVKIARSGFSQNFMDTAKTKDLTCLCLQINNTVVFFSNHTHIKLIMKFKAETMSTVNRKYTKFGVIPFYVSHSIELRTFIVEQGDSVNSRSRSRFDYILPENNPGKLSKQNKLI